MNSRAAVIFIALLCVPLVWGTVLAAKMAFISFGDRDYAFSALGAASALFGIWALWSLVKIALRRAGERRDSEL